MGKKTYQRDAEGRYFSQPRNPISGKREKVTADTVLDLERKLGRIRDVRQDMRLGSTIQEAEHRLSPVMGCRMLVDECFSRYRAGLKRSAEKGDSVWERRLAPWFAGKNLWELTADVMRAWEAEQRRAGLAMATVRLAYDMLAAAVNLQIPAIIPGHPWGKWRPEREHRDERYVPKRPALGTLEAFQALVSHATESDKVHWSHGRYSVNARVTVFLGLCGLRQGEAAGLGWDHVEIDGHGEPILWVQYQAARGWRNRHEDRPRDEPKDGSRRIHMHPVVVELLQKQREDLQARGWYRQDGPVFPGPRGKWLISGRVIKPKNLKKWARAAGFPRWEQWCAHSLRHSNIMLELLASGGDFVAVMKRSGHSDVQVMRAYMHSMGGEMPASRIGIGGEAVNRLLPAVPTTGEAVIEAPQVETPKIEPKALVMVDALRRLDEDARESVRDDRKKIKQEKRDRSYDSLEDVYRRWDLAGRPGKQPQEITMRARRAYMKGYNEALREGKTKEECQAEGAMARGRMLGAWVTACRRLGKVVSTPPPPPPVSLTPPESMGQYVDG